MVRRTPSLWGFMKFIGASPGLAAVLLYVVLLFECMWEHVMASENLTVRIPRELRERMRRHPEVRWSEVVRRAIEDFLDRLEGRDVERGEEFLKRAGLKEEDVLFEPPQGEVEFQRRVGEAEWRRVRSSTIQAR